MKPGTRWTIASSTRRGGPDGRHTVTSETKKLANGITARVVRDTVTEDGEVVEDTFDWYAQDGRGNIWYLGEDTAEFEDGGRHREGPGRPAGTAPSPVSRSWPIPATTCSTGRSTTRGKPRTWGGPQHGGAGAGPAGHYTNAAQGHERARAERARVQALRAERRPGAHAGCLARRPGGAAEGRDGRRRPPGRPRRRVSDGPIPETADLVNPALVAREDHRPRFAPAASVRSGGASTRAGLREQRVQARSSMPSGVRSRISISTRPAARASGRRHAPSRRRPLTRPTWPGA